MGEMADFYLDSEFSGPHTTLLEDNEDYHNYREDPWDRFYNTPTCKYCQSKQVYWSKIAGRWRLHDVKTKKPHVCKEYLNSANAN